MKKVVLTIVLSILFVFLGENAGAKAALEKDVKDKSIELKANKTVTNVQNTNYEENWYRLEVTETGSQQFSFKSTGVGESRFIMSIYVVDDDGVLQQAYSEKMSD